MTNQVLQQKGLSRLGGDGRREGLAVLAVVLVLLVAVLVVLSNLGPRSASEVKPVNTSGLSAIPLDGRAYFTEPYWNMAAESESALAPASAAPEFATYTDRYWNLAAESESALAPASAQPEFATYTDRYWNLAEETAAEVPAPVTDGPAYFTEPYWNMAREHDAAHD